MVFQNFKDLCDAFDIDIEDVDFINEDTTNIYRTDEFIVSQHLAFCGDGFGSTSILSEDTFYYRTKLRDMIYEKLFSDDGKRLRSSMFVRTYIE